MERNELQTVGLFLALDGISTRTDPSTSGRNYCKSVNMPSSSVMKAYLLFQQQLQVHSN